MKNKFYIGLAAAIIGCTAISCKKEDNNNTETNYDVTQAYNLTDIAYGSDAQQKMDVYLPANRTSASTKVFVMIHGGGWSAGDKSDYTSNMTSLKAYYPDHAIININYRLGTQESPGYPKQINDIQAALDEIQKDKYNVSKQYLLYGGSAGGHLSLLYAYAFDSSHYVKGVINTVGPADLTDSSFTGNLILMGVIGGLVGNAIYNYQANQALFIEVSPAKQVTSLSPPTLSFYGDQDPLVPVTQMPLLRAALEDKTVWHYDTIYPGGGHGVWASEAQNQDYSNRTIEFINQFFN
ncbi:prolyl oligopeptidase family serine peptidase [Parafilimonas sp.]|uniref:prolyl oligopeptidase family serine peptidase n=1 Tax=Parafilimonas sp. TaxID=1969739 RepID=UPI0039E5959B